MPVDRRDKMQVWVCFPRYRWYDKAWQGCEGVKGHKDCGWFQLVEVVEHVDDA